jgi:small subunit ribosomal protein S2
LEVIDLVATIEALKKALEAVSGLVAQGKTILLIGTQPAARGTVEEVAKALGFPYVTSRWLGGTLTNFKTFQGRIAHFKSLGAKIDSPDFEKYTKRERLQFQTEHRELKEKFTGILEITSLPGAVFVIGVKRHATAVKEAHKLGIPVVAVVNTDDDPTAVTWPIPANDNSAASVKFILEKFRAKVEEARKKVAAAAVEASEKKE